LSRERNLSNPRGRPTKYENVCLAYLVYLVSLVHLVYLVSLVHLVSQNEEQSTKNKELYLVYLTPRTLFPCKLNAL
jgi:hypothetical protein